MKLLWIAVILSGLGLQSALAHADENRCRHYSEGDTRSACAGKQLPRDKTRGRSQSRLVCNGNVDHFIRKPQEIPNFEGWADAINREGSRSNEAFKMRTDASQVPDIKWTGRIPYTVTEEWTWIDCIHGTNGSECGYDRECHEEQYTYTTTSCDDDNNCDTETHTGTREVCNDVPRSCWYDVKRYETMHCSQEAITFDARYVRDTVNWNPSNPSYNEFIPNKYDLMPGELEDVQVYSNVSSGTSLRPSVEIGDAWNKYDIRLSGSAVGAACRQNAREHLSVAIHTVERLIKASPNAFRLPVRFDGSAMAPLAWTMAEDGEGRAIKGQPNTLRLSDTSAALVGMIAKQSRENAEREAQKRTLGLDANQDAMSPSSKAMDPFFKNTELRVSLVESKWWGYSSFSPYLFISDSEAMSSANYSMSQLQQIRTSEFWKIPLNDPENNMSIYRRDNWVVNILGGREKALKPNQRYVLRLSMYQKGVPFYKQCADGGSECKEAFSKPIEVPFWTHPEYDERALLQQVNQWTLVDWIYGMTREKPASEDGAVPKPGNEVWE